MIKEYWNLTDREPFLAITWKPDFSQACSFRRMLMNHKNFHFTQIPDKTNDLPDFLKKFKNHIFGRKFTIFGHFCPMGIFFKKSGSVIWAPNTMLRFRKNYWANSEKTYRQMEGRTDGGKDGLTLFYRTLPAEAGGPIIYG